MWHLMFRPQTCSRRDAIMIFFTDQKGSLYRSEIENIIDQMVTKMGPEETELTCKEKQPLVDSEVNDEDGNVLDIGTNMPEHFDDDEHDAVQFAPGTDTPPPARPFRRSPLSAFTIRRFDLVGFDEPTRPHEHRMDPPVDLDYNYGVDDDESSISTFSTTDGNSDLGDDIDDSDSVIDDDDDDEFVAPERTDGDDIDDEDDDFDDDDDHDGSGVIALEDEF